MEEVNNSRELNNTDKKLNISDVMCSCDACGEIYDEPNPVENFGEFNICDKCKDKKNVWLD
jgi:hypothetical protein